MTREDNQPVNCLPSTKSSNNGFQFLSMVNPNPVPLVNLQKKNPALCANLVKFSSTFQPKSQLCCQTCWSWRSFAVIRSLVPMGYVKLSTYENLRGCNFLTHASLRVKIKFRSAIFSFIQVIRVYFLQLL